MKRDFKPVHPGIILAEIIGELNISQVRLAQDIGLSAMRISHIIHGTRPVTGEIALLLGRYFGHTPQFWMNLQVNYDVQTAALKMGKGLKAVRPYKLARAS